MFVISLSPANVAGATWANATRTLTADPATDAGSATLNWTHATRTITADPATDAGAATLVWTHTGRTLSQLLNLFSGANAINQSLANGTVLDLRPAASKVRFVFAVGQLSGAQWRTGVYDGTNFGDNNGTDSTNFGFGVGYSGAGFSVKATGGSAITYSYVAIDLQ
jgi:hypothetical protein